MTWMRRLGALCTAVVLTVIVGASPASAGVTQPPPGFYRLSNLNVQSNCILGAGPVMLYTCAGYNDQVWYLSPPPAEPWDFIMKNLVSGKCLATTNTHANSLVVEQTCNYDDLHQVWQWNSVYYTPDVQSWRVWNVASGLCLLGLNGAWKVAITQYYCGNYPDQLWNVLAD